MRPGYLNGYQPLVPKSFGLGGGKSDFEPPPAPPPGAETVALTNAYDKKTGKFYMQNIKCPEGEKMATCSESTHEPVAGCKVSECCDVVFGPPFCVTDCDPDAPTGECDDDPNYVEFPEGTWASCNDVIAAFKSKGIPEGFAKAYCEEEGVGTSASTQTAQTTQAPAQTAQPQTVAPAKPQVVRPPLSIAYTGSCPKTHFKATDALGDFCKPCSPGQLFYGGKCQPKPPACACNLKRIGDPDFGKCPPPPKGCGPPPKAQKCNVPGYGPTNPVCKCGKWQCPTNKDLLIAKWKRQGKAIPKGIAGFGGLSDYKKPLIGLGLLGAAIACYFWWIKK